MDEKPIILKEANQKEQTKRYLRIWQIVGGKGYEPRIPISKSALWKAVREGRFPAPVHLGPRTTAWLESEVDAWVYRNEAA